MTGHRITEFSQPWGNHRHVGEGLWRIGRRNEALFKAIREEREALRPLCTAWREAAEADGWVFGPTYQNEPLGHAFRGTKEGFTLLGLCRPTTDRECPSPSLHIWGPDSLQVAPPLEYDWEAIKAGVRVCGYCRATDVDTTRVGFAGRCCLGCEPTIRPRVEQGNWTA